MKPEQRVLGFDFGLKRIGVAVGQTVTASAKPLKTIKANHGLPDWQAITALITTWAPNAFIVGLPLSTDGRMDTVVNAASEFATQLTTRYALRVHTIDEQFTTVAARQKVFDQGGYKALKTAEIDSVAAQLIIESWLQEQTPCK